MHYGANGTRAHLGPTASTKSTPPPVRSKRQISDSQNAEGDPLRSLLPCGVQSVTQQRLVPLASRQQVR
jgi:hypothetical protein